LTDEERFAELRRRLEEVDDVRKAAWVLQWDLETMMPPAGADVRAEQLGTLAGLAHERFTSDELGELLEQLRGYEAALEYESDEASLIRVARREYDRARRVPTELRTEMVRAAAHGSQAWRRAREANDYDVFRPALERNLELQARYVECLDDGVTEPYDVLVADYEPGLTTADVAAVFERLRDELAPLVATLEPAGERPFDLGLSDVERRETVDKVLARLGFERDWGRVDTSVHPFTVNFGTADIRLTTHADADLRALYAALHEFGHGLYERGVDPALERTLLAEGASGALHESQSLLWENLVGRGRPFCSWLAGEVDGVDSASLYRAVNRVGRSLIRVDADPVTYSLHVIFRFELERDLVSGVLTAGDLRDAWNGKVEKFLGLQVPDDLRGVLQDMHWADSTMGYFPSYALGHVASAQIWELAQAELGELDEHVERGEFGPLRDWLRERLHRHGRKFTTPETMERALSQRGDLRAGRPVVSDGARAKPALLKGGSASGAAGGGGFDPGPLLRYVRAKIEDQS
jgi:carboxypeptidase Taq